jgi:hypothetical protein
MQNIVRHAPALRGAPIASIAAGLIFASESRPRCGRDVPGVAACEYHCAMHARLAIVCAIGSVCSALAGHAGAATEVAPSSVYKCRQPNGTVLYQDYACKDGVVVDIKPDAADPAAIRRLERAQAEDQREAARRRAREASEERHREALERMRSEAEAAQVYAPQADLLSVPPYPYYVPQARPRLQPHAPRAGHERRRVLLERRVPATARHPHAG